MTNGNGKNGNYTAAQFIAAIPGSGGIISATAKRVVFGLVNDRTRA